MECKCYADLAANGKPIILKCSLCKSAPDLYEALEAIINSETIANRDNFNNALEALAEARETK